MAINRVPRAFLCKKLFRQLFVDSIPETHIERFNRRKYSNVASTVWRSNANSRLTWATKEMGKLMKAYEDFVGVTEIKDAQAKVVEAERQFVETQDLRREKQNEIQQVQFRLKEIHSEMDKVSRGEDRFYELFNKEHAVIKQEKELVRDLDKLERDEKQKFLLFSTAIRETHEAERVHSERTKYWPIIGSFVTFVGASLYGIYRMHKLQSILSGGMASVESAERLEGLLTDVGDSVKSQHRQLTGFVSELKSMLGSSSGSSSDAPEGVARASELESSSSKSGAATGDGIAAEDLAAMLSEMKSRSGELSTDIEDIKKMIAAGSVSAVGEEGGRSVVYVGPEMRQLLGENEKRLEFKIKANALATVVSIYVAFAITLPLLYAIFKGQP